MIETEVVGLEAPDLPRMGWGLAPARGVYHRPRSGEPRAAFIATHYNLDFSEHYLAAPLAERGYGFLGWNTRFCGREPFFRLDGALTDIGLGVTWLRNQGVETVVLLGNSGGGSLMAKAAGDLFVSLAAHPGRPEVLTNWLDPAVTDEADPTETDPALDMYNPDNGPPYSAEFIARYREAQRARNDQISAWCLAELERLRAAGYRDRLFTVHRTWADLRFTDAALDPSDRPTPACYLGDPAMANRGADGIATASTLRTWLAMWSLEHSEESFSRVEAPSLVIQAKGDTGVFPSDARAIFDALETEDKRLVELPGDHYFRGPGNPREELADQIAHWVAER